jgi:hypothetical protein
MLGSAKRLLRQFVPRLAAALAGASALVMLASATIGSAQPAPGQPLTIHLEAGWNNFAYFGIEQEPAVALASISGKYTAVWHWDATAQRYLSYRPAEPAAASLTRLQGGRSYWIVTTEPADFAMAAPRPGLVPALAPGWNNLVYTGAATSVDEGLHALAGHYSAVHAWDAAEQRFRGHGPGTSSDLSGLAPFACYWLEFF